MLDKQLKQTNKQTFSKLTQDSKEIQFRYDLNSAYIPSIRKQHTRFSWVSTQVIKEKKKKKEEEKDPIKL